MANSKRSTKPFHIVGIGASAGGSPYVMLNMALNSGSRSEMGSGHTLSLLFVEDDLLVCDITCDMIAMTFPGITVHKANNGRIGLEIFKEQFPDIVVTDINMPDMDGVQMVGDIKKIKTDTRFILLTGYSDNQYDEKLRGIGISTYLVKPVEMGKLFASIEKCINDINLQHQ